MKPKQRKQKALTIEYLRDIICRALALPKDGLGFDDNLRDKATIDSLAIEIMALELEALSDRLLDLDALYRCETVRDVWSLVTASDV